MLTSRPGKIAKNENTRIHRPVRGSSARVEGNSQGPDQTTDSLLDDALTLAKRKHPRPYPEKIQNLLYRRNPDPAVNFLSSWPLNGDCGAAFVQCWSTIASSEATYLSLRALTSCAYIPFSTQSKVISFR